MNTLPTDDLHAAAERESRAHEREKRLAFRRALDTDAGRKMLAYLAAAVGIHQVSVPYDSTGRVDAVEIARRDGARGIVLEMMEQAGIEIAFEFPPLADASGRPHDIETE